MYEHLTVIETTTILKLLEAQRQTHDALYDLVMMMREKQKAQNDEKQQSVKMVVSR